MRQIAISDIHGCIKTFRGLLYRTLALSKHDELFLLGDFVDRGPDSKAVIDEVFALIEKGQKVHCLKGNHEQMMLDAATSLESQQLFMQNGGYTTLASFGVNRVDEVPQRYMDWMKGLGYWLCTDHFYLVHAGFNFKAPDPLQDLDAMLWIRQWYGHIDEKWLGKRRIIHGHTPTKKILIHHAFELKSRALNIDNGCVHIGKQPGLGHLCAYDMTNDVMYYRLNEDV